MIVSECGVSEKVELEHPDFPLFFHGKVVKLICTISRHLIQLTLFVIFGGQLVVDGWMALSLLRAQDEHLLMITVQCKCMKLYLYYYFDRTCIYIRAGEEERSDSVHIYYLGA